jgi:Ca2+-binding RTX toxin-like protein
MNSSNTARMPHFQLVLVFATALVIYFIIFDLSVTLDFDRHLVSAFKPTAPGNQSQTVVTPNNLTTRTINQPPVVNVGSDQIVDEKAVANLHSIAVDPEGDKLTYVWNQIVGPEVKLLNGNTTNPSFTAPEVSDDTPLKFALTVTDARGAPAKEAIVTITVKHVNHKPLSNAGQDQVVNPGNIVTLNGTSSKDQDNDRLTYSWFQISGRPLVKLNGADRSITTFIIPPNVSADTNLIFRLMVQDNKKSNSTDDVKVTIKYNPPPNKPPIANAGTDQTVDASDGIVYLNASNSNDPDGNITSYSWVQTSGPPVMLNNSDTVRPTFIIPSDISVDTPLKFVLTAIDDRGAESKNSAVVTITVKHINKSPVADAGQDQMVNAGDTVTLDGTRSSNPDSDSLSYLWIQISGPPVQLNEADIASLSFKAPINIIADTNLIIRLIVTDDENGTDYDDVNIRVKYIHRSLPHSEQPPPISNNQSSTARTNQTTTTSAPAPPVPAINGTLPINSTVATPTEQASKSEQTDFVNTIEGEDKQDNLSGTNETDNIEGHGKDDVIHGQAGNDRIEGDTGNDRLYGDEGNDLIEGGDKDDLLEGGEGDDTLSGDDGDDRMTGGTGKDHFNCGDGNLDRILDFNEGEGDTKELDCEVTTPDISEE